jgi:hypothetical protein
VKLGLNPIGVIDTNNGSKKFSTDEKFIFLILKAFCLLQNDLSNNN